MNLRQKYKKAKHRLDILEKSTKVIPYDIVQLQAVHMITYYDRLVFTDENMDELITDKLFEEVKKYVEIPREPGRCFNSAEVVVAKLNIAIPRR